MSKTWVATDSTPTCPGISRRSLRFTAASKSRSHTSRYRASEKYYKQDALLASYWLLSCCSAVDVVSDCSDALLGLPLSDCTRFRRPREGKHDRDGHDEQDRDRHPFDAEVLWEFSTHSAFHRRFEVAEPHFEIGGCFGGVLDDVFTRVTSAGFARQDLGEESEELVVAAPRLRVARVRTARCPTRRGSGLYAFIWSRFPAVSCAGTAPDRRGSRGHWPLFLSRVQSRRRL